MCSATTWHVEKSVGHVFCAPVYDKTTVVTLDNRQSFVVGLNSTVTLIHVSALLTRNSSLVPNGSSNSKLCLVVARSDDYEGNS